MTSSMISYGMSTHHLDVLPPDHCLPGRISNFLGKNYKAAFLGKANVMGVRYSLGPLLVNTRVGSSSFFYYYRKSTQLS